MGYYPQKPYCGKRRKSLFNIQCHLQNRLCSLHSIHNVDFFLFVIFVGSFFVTAQLTFIAGECLADVCRIGGCRACASRGSRAWRADGALLLKCGAAVPALSTAAPAEVNSVPHDTQVGGGLCIHPLLL